MVKGIDMTLDQKAHLISIIEKQLQAIDEHTLLIEQTGFVQKMLTLRTSLSVLKDKINQSSEKDLNFKAISSNIVEITVLFTNSAIKELETMVDEYRNQY